MRARLARTLGWGLALSPLAIPVFFFWASLAGRAVPSFRDQSDFFFPSHRYTAKRILAGELPLWNALSGNGETWIGNGQNEIFYPPAASFLIPNGATASGVFLVFHFAAAYLLMLGFLRERGATLPAAVLGAALFSFSGIAVSLSAFWNHFAAAAWIPGLAWSAGKGLSTRRARAAFAACFSLAVLSGGPEMAVLGTAIAVAVFWAKKRDEEAAALETGNTRVPRWSFFSFSVFLGLLISAAAWVPFLDTLSRSASRASIPTAGLPWRELFSLVAPPSHSPVPWMPAELGYLQSLYLSAPALLLIAAAFLLAGDLRRRALALSAAAACFVVAAIGWSVFFRYPAKLTIAALFLLSALAADGLDGLRFSSPSRARRILVPLLALSTVLAALLCRGPVERATILAAGLFALAASSGPPGRARAAFAALAAGALAAHFAVALSPLLRTAPLSAFLEKPKPARGKVLTTQDEYLSFWSVDAPFDETQRVRRQIDSLEGYSNLPFGIAKARTASALPSREESTYAQSLTGLSNFMPPAAVAGCGEVRFPVGNTVGRVIISPTLSGSEFFFEDRRETEPARALAQLYSGRVPMRSVLVVDHGSVASGGLKTVALSSTLSQSEERAELAVTLSCAAWLYRAQTFDPWWRARIDGKRAEIVRANGVFSALLLPAGLHRVVWQYVPWPFYAGALLSAAGLLAAAYLALAGEPVVRTRRLR